MQNCGVRLLPLDFRDQYFGCEIELTGINRATAAQTLADLFGTRAEHSGGGYDAYRVKDLDGKEWKIVRDGSIHPECRRRSVLIGETYKVELNSPKLEYGEMEKLQEVVRALRHAGAVVNGSCGMHVHVDASKHTPQSLKNALSIMYSKEDILFKALNVNEHRVERWCQKVREPMLEKIRAMRPEYQSVPYMQGFLAAMLFLESAKRCLDGNKPLTGDNLKAALNSLKDFDTGGLIAAGIGLLFMPWKLLATSGGYLFTWLGGYGTLLGAIAGILLVDYYLVRKSELKVDDLYRRGGEYEYSNGWNVQALIAFALGVLPCLPGYLAVSGVIDKAAVPGLLLALIDFGWFFSLAVAGTYYYLTAKKK